MSEDPFYARDPDELAMYTIYERPRDYPAGYIMRRFDIKRGHRDPVPTPHVRTGSTLEEVRRYIPRDLYCMGRDPEDHPTVVESWC